MKSNKAIRSNKPAPKLKDLTPRKNAKGGTNKPIPGVDIFVKREPPCWVAREVYGAENREWMQFRGWLLGSGRSEFIAFYKLNGAEISRKIASQPKIKELIRHLMDAVKG